MASAAVAADDNTTVIASVMAMPPLDFVPAELTGQPVIMVRVCCLGGPDQTEQALAPLRLAGRPLADLVGPMPYSELFAEPPPSQGSVVAARNLFVDRIDDTAAGIVVSHLGRTDAWLRMVQFRPMGGAINRVAVDATAFAHRTRRLMVTIACNAQPDLERARGWVEELAADLPHVEAGAYIGFFGPHDTDRIDQAYPPPTLARLRRIKAAVDPRNLFRHNDNIIPASDPPRSDDPGGTR